MMESTNTGLFFVLMIQGLFIFLGLAYWLISGLMQTNRDSYISKDSIIARARTIKSAAFLSEAGYDSLIYKLMCYIDHPYYDGKLLYAHSAAKDLALEIDKHIILTRGEYNALLAKTIS